METQCPDIATHPIRWKLSSGQGDLLKTTWRCFSVFMCHLPSLSFPQRSIFETTFPSAPSSSNCPRPESAGQAHTWPSPTHSTGCEPKQPEKTTSADNDTTLINDPDHNFSDFSKTICESTRQFGVSTFFESSVLHISHWWFCFSKKACNRERGKQSMSRKSRRNSAGSHSLRLTENCILTNEISENTLNDELNKLYLMKMQFREFFFDWVRHGDPKFGTKKCRIRIVRVTTRASISKTAVVGGQAMMYFTEHDLEIQTFERGNSKYALFESQREPQSQGQQLLEAKQSKLSVREFTCVVNWRWRTVILRNATHEVTKKLKNEEENEATVQKLNEFSIQHDQESRAVSPFFCGQLLTFLIQESLVAKLEFFEIHGKRWVFRKIFIECQHARRDLDELYNDSRNLATLLLIRRTKGIESAQRVVAQMAQNLGVLCSKGIRCVVARLLCLSRCGWGHAHNAAGVVRQPLRLLSGQREGLVHWMRLNPRFCCFWTPVFSNFRLKK